MTANPPVAPRTLKLGRTQQSVAASLSGAEFSWAPIFAAMAIDVADFFSVGPVGWVAGLFLGGLLTVIVSLAAGARLRRALAFGVLGGIYCAMPLTGPIPLATMLTLVHAFVQRSQLSAAATVEPAPVQAHVAAGRVEQLG